VASEARLQAELALPGVAPVVEHGVASGIPYVAVPGGGQPFVLPARALDAPRALSLAAEAARVLHGLALAGVVLPDAAPARFLHGPSAGATAGEGLVLADLDGARRVESAVASPAHLALALAFTAALLRGEGARVPDAIANLLRDPPGGGLPALVVALDAWSLRAARE
jgi:hypothetical protein